MNHEITDIITQNYKPKSYVSKRSSFFEMNLNKIRFTYKKMMIYIKPKNRKETVIFNQFWKSKFKQSLKLECCRIVIDDKVYLINHKDGFMAALGE